MRPSWLIQPPKKLYTKNIKGKVSLILLIQVLTPFPGLYRQTFPTNKQERFMNIGSGGAL